MEKIDWKNLDGKAIKKEVGRLKKECFNLRLNSAAGQAKDYSQFKKLRKEIARALTFLNQKN